MTLNYCAFKLPRGFGPACALFGELSVLMKGNGGWPASDIEEDLGMNRAIMRKTDRIRWVGLARVKFSHQKYEATECVMQGYPKAL